MAGEEGFCRNVFRAYRPPGSQIVLIKEFDSIVIVFCELAFVKAIIAMLLLRKSLGRTFHVLAARTKNDCW